MFDLLEQIFSWNTEPPGSVFFTILSREVGTFVRYNGNKVISYNRLSRIRCEEDETYNPDLARAADANRACSFPRRKRL